MLGYDYWGHCDCDLIWGDLSVLNSVADKGFDRIGEHGHLALYKNTEEVSRWFATLRTDGVPTYRQVFSSDKSFSFDEFPGMNRLVEANCGNVWRERLFDDIIFYKRNFWSRRLIDGKDTKSDAVYFLYENARLTRHVYREGKWLADESLYVHLQKRKLSIETSDTKSYMVIPDRIVSIGRYSQDELRRLCSPAMVDKKYLMMLLKSQLKKLL